MFMMFVDVGSVVGFLKVSCLLMIYVFLILFVLFGLLSMCFCRCSMMLFMIGIYFWSCCDILDWY